MRLTRSMSSSTSTSILDSVEKGLDALKRVEDVVETVEEIAETVEDVGETVEEVYESLNKAIPDLCDEWEKVLNGVRDLRDDF